MANQKKRKKAPVKSRKPVTRQALGLFSRKKSSMNEFRPDRMGGGLLKALHLTQQQRLTLLRWTLYAAVCVLCLVLQDVVMSRIHIFGATTDLAPAAMLLIGVLEGSEVGGVFLLLASVVYHFSGSSPGAFTVALLTVIGVLMSLLRQRFWRRSPGSIILCAGIAMVAYELAVFAAGIFMGMTHFGRVGAFLLCGLLSLLVQIPLYFLIYKIGLIGGNQWKE